MSASEPQFDLEAAHRFFSADCFNTAWDLIDQPRRTPEEDERMLQLAFAALWHWTRREDCTDKRISIGNWQIARIYALLGQPENARRYARRSLEAAERGQVAPFYTAYAFEALARAEAQAGNLEAAAEYLENAHLFAARVTDPEPRKALFG